MLEMCRKNKLVGGATPLCFYLLFSLGGAQFQRHSDITAWSQRLE